jgi:hypothetical protein
MNRILNSKVYSQQQNDNSLDRELDIFFEKAALGGANNVAKMTVEERVERAERGAFLEDEIFLIVDRLRNLQDEYMSGNDKVLPDIKSLQDELSGLKQDYIDLVGGGSNLPIYFGRTGPPESFQ